MNTTAAYAVVSCMYSWLTQHIKGTLAWLWLRKQWAGVMCALEADTKIQGISATATAVITYNISWLTKHTQSSKPCTS